MDEPCPGAIVRSSAEPTKIIRDGNSIITASKLCHQCEKGWTQTHGNAHWEHCSTPREVRVTFTGINKCSHDPPYPDPPNGHEFVLKLQSNGGCFWFVSEVIDGDTWNVGYRAFDSNGVNYTDLAMDVSDKGDGFPGTYFKLDLVTPSYGPCYPLSSGGQLNNVSGCVPGCGYGGYGTVSWDEPSSVPV
jgi:hypothetical protein